ncbi:MAG: hypothetical protein HKN29_16490 [Rhodothermales bacterium]|nr:hypothetical protein [Rhodothermales bacterium]
MHASGTGLRKTTDTVLAQFPCPQQFRQEFGYTYVTLVIGGDGQYAVIDPHRSSLRVVLDQVAVERLSKCVPVVDMLRQESAAAHSVPAQVIEMHVGALAGQLWEERRLFSATG